MDQTNDVLKDDEQSRSAGGMVVSLHVAPSADIPMTSLLSAQVVPGRGMVGDRYYLRRGRDAAYDELTCDVTLFDQRLRQFATQQIHSHFRKRLRNQDARRIPVLHLKYNHDNLSPSKLGTLVLSQRSIDKK